jgi:hypothetical protein
VTRKVVGVVRFRVKPPVSAATVVASCNRLRIAGSGPRETGRTPEETTGESEQDAGQADSPAVSHAGGSSAAEDTDLQATHPVQCGHPSTTESI